MTDENTQARLKRLCRALGIPVDDQLIADPEAHFSIYGQLCRVAEGWKKELAILQAATRDAPTLPVWFDTFLTNVCELSDRNSPAEEQDAIVATLEELSNCALNAIEHCAASAPKEAT